MSSRRRATPIPLALALAACGVLDPADDPVDITGLPRSLTVAEASVIENGNAFGFELLGEVLERDGRPNVVLSPLSASMALGMTLNGADGTTFDAMSATLGFASLSQEEINASYSGLIDLLTTLDPSVRFDIANAVWANQDVTFHQAFFDAVRTAFAAEAASRDFGDPATLTEINAWVDEATNGLIDSILESLDPALVMLLVNAIYFDGAWTTEFDPAETRPGDFTREDGSTVPVELMRLSSFEVASAWTPEYASIELPYGGRAFSMVVVMPNGGTVRELAAAMDADAWAALVGALTPIEMGVVSIPKLALEYDAFLNDALVAMGMEEAFRNGADFSRMTPASVCIDFVRQKTFMEVDERGTRAAAVTAVGVGPTSAPPSFVADRPFLLAIRERFSGTVLFLGVVGDPTASPGEPGEYERRCG